MFSRALLMRMVTDCFRLICGGGGAAAGVGVSSREDARGIIGILVRRRGVGLGGGRGCSGNVECTHVMCYV